MYVVKKKQFKENKNKHKKNLKKNYTTVWFCI